MENKALYMHHALLTIQMTIQLQKIQEGPHILQMVD